MKRLLGIIDILSALWLVLIYFNIVSIKGAILLGILLIIKGFVFRESWVSWVDFGVGVYMCILFLAPATFLNFVAALWLLQKGIWSFF